ncbi:SCO6880 family protein [Amycolatopsis sp. GM8]|uniref:SCO6880 family protein n=1 Tax=Amycolatopsis sp. GM8 TaxID=2896530 RepID=UPI001F1B3022|nr:SCO6880 family protein [Amycolatopsis sp. GM8]
MSTEEQDFVFPPRRTNGIFGRIGLGQAIAVLIGIALPWLGIRSGSPIVFAFASAAGACVVAVAFSRIGGRAITQWVRPVLGAVWSQVRGSHVYRGAVFGPSSLAHRMDLPGDLAGLRMLSAPSPDGHTRIGLVLDESSETVTAALMTEGTPIILEDTAEQASRLDEWEAVMESTTDEDGAVSRWQLLFRSMPDSTNLAQRYYLDRTTDREAPSAQALRELVSQAAPVGQRHEVFVAVAFDLARLSGEIKSTGGDDEAIGIVVVERLAELQRQIAEARIPVRGWLSPGHYAAVIHSQFDPDSLPLYDLQAGRDSELDPRAAGPSATERQWRAFVHDSAFSSTIWVHEMPRRPVSRNWLTPLLQHNDVRRAVTLVAEPLGVSRAERSINNQRLAAGGSIHAKARHGLVIDARTRRELDAAERLDDEIAEGAGYFRYSMLVTCTAPDMVSLRTAVTAVRRRLTRIRCASMVLYGEQDQGFYAAALPLARGLAPMWSLTGT